MIQYTINSDAKFKDEIIAALKGFSLEFMHFTQEGREYYMVENPSEEIAQWIKSNCILQNEMVMGNKGKTMTLIAMQWDQLDIDPKKITEGDMFMTYLNMLDSGKTLAEIQATIDSPEKQAGYEEALADVRRYMNF